MAAGVLAFTGSLALSLNSSFVYTLIWQDANDNPIDLTGYQAKMSIANSPSPTTTYITLSSTGMSPEITFDAVNGKIFLTIPQTVVESSFAAFLVSGVLNAVYDLLLYPPSSGPEFVFLQGPFQVLAGVTSP